MNRPSRPSVRYRVQVTELIDDQPAGLVIDTIGGSFHAAVGDHSGSRLLAEHALGGHPHVLEDLAQLIADHPTGPQQPKRR